MCSSVETDRKCIQNLVVIPLGRTRRRCEDNIKMHLIEMCSMKLTVDHAEGCIQLKALVLVIVLNLPILLVQLVNFMK
jgi:hypothetical protein